SNHVPPAYEPIRMRRLWRRPPLSTVLCATDFLCAFVTQAAQLSVDRRESWPSQSFVLRHEGPEFVLHRLGAVDAVLNLALRLTHGVDRIVTVPVWTSGRAGQRLEPVLDTL